MRNFFISCYIVLCCLRGAAQIGFSKPFDFSQAGLAFSSLEYNGGHTISIYGNLIDTNLKHGLLFASFDTLGNLLDYNVEYDSLNDVFTLVYPNSFIRLSDSSGYAGVGSFFYSKNGYLTIYNNNGTIRRFAKYEDLGTLTDFYIEIIEVPDGFFILGDKQLNDYHSHIFLMKTDKAGNKLWERLYGHPTRENYYGSIVKVNDNEYMIGGATSTTPPFPQLVYNTSNFYVIDSLGNLKSSWQSQLSTTDMGVTFGMQRTEQGGWVYAAVELRFEPPLNVYESKLKLIERDSQFNIINEKAYGNFRPNNIQQNFKKLSNADYLMLGTRSIQFSAQTQYPSLNMGSLLRVSPNGDSIWNFLDTAFGLAQNRIYDAVELPSGSIITCGYSQTLNPPKDWAWLVKVSKDGCVDTLNCFPVSSISTIAIKDMVNIYPNPAADRVTIGIQSEADGIARVTDLQGKIVQETVLLAGSAILSTAFLPNGMYLVQILSKQGRIIASRKLVVQH